jgi:hypothetical protein
MARMCSLVPARKVVVAALAAGGASYLLGTGQGQILGLAETPGGVALLVGLAAFVGGYATRPAETDWVEATPSRPSAPQATSITAAS